MTAAKNVIRRAQLGESQNSGEFQYMTIYNPLDRRTHFTLIRKFSRANKLDLKMGQFIDSQISNFVKYVRLDECGGQGIRGIRIHNPLFPCRWRGIVYFVRNGLLSK